MLLPLSGLAFKLVGKHSEIEIWTDLPQSTERLDTVIDVEILCTICIPIEVNIENSNYNVKNVERKSGLPNIHFAVVVSCDLLK